MNEYDVTFFVPQGGALAIDIHNSTGTSPVARFESIENLRQFFSSLGIQEDRLAAIEKICSSVTPEQAYHERMFLPPALIEAVEHLTAKADGAGALPVPPDGSGAARHALRV